MQYPFTLSVNNRSSSQLKWRLSELLVLILIVGSVILGYSGGSSAGGDSGSSKPGTKQLTRVEALRADINFLTAQMRAIHANLFHSITEQEFTAAATTLKNALPALTDNEVFVEIKKLVALPASQEDGHMEVTMFQATNFRFFPLRLYIFADGVFVINATPPYEHAIGKRIVQIGGMDVEAINALIDPLLTRDNEMDVVYKITLHYVVPEILHTLGIIANVEQGDYLLEDANGNLSVLTVPPIDKEVYRNTIGNSVGLFEQPNPLYLSNLTERFWMQVLPGTQALYIKYNQVQATTQSGSTMTAFTNRIFATVAQQAITKVIIDLRFNPGGNAFTFEPLIEILSRALINQPKTLYALIGRQTFSAGANFVTVLEQRAAHVVFAGEPTGGSLNNFGDVQRFGLPRTGYGIAVPTIYWQYAAPGDSRLAIAPHLPVVLTSDDYFNLRDPVLEAVLSDSAVGTGQCQHGSDSSGPLYPRRRSPSSCR